MLISRRKLLRDAIVLSMGASATASFAQASAHTCKVLVPANRELYPWLSSGEGLLVDTRLSTFTDNGLYLYPAWGLPRVYQVEEVWGKAGRSIGFFNPVSRQLLWQHSLQNADPFAGRVVRKLSSFELAQARYAPLDLTAYSLVPGQSPA